MNGLQVGSSGSTLTTEEDKKQGRAVVQFIPYIWDTKIQYGMSWSGLPTANAPTHEQ